MTKTDFDIAICGAGPIGMALALLLAQCGVDPARIGLIDAKTIDQAKKDPRSVALSFGSRQILEDLGAWPAAVSPIREIHVSRRRHFGRTLIRSSDYGLPALGYVCRYGALIDVLASAAGLLALQSMRPAQIVSSLEQADHVELKFADGALRTAGIVVQSEGGVFGEQAGKAVSRDYAQVAVVARVKVSLPLPQRAFERFTDEGPLALLPQEDGYALVWCVSPGTAERLLKLEEAVFLAELGRAFGGRLGEFQASSARSSYPLGLSEGNASSLRSVAIGNAAQTLHPVAGQGLNLGLRDATVLARHLAQECAPASLENFIRSRGDDRRLTIRLTDLMARIFSSAPDGALTQSWLGLSLGLIDALPPAKRLLAEQMMFGRR